MSAPTAKMGAPTEPEVKVGDYRMQHRPPGPHYGAPFHDLTKMYGDDVYEHPEWYGEPHPETSRSLLKARGRPRQQVDIYRALPHGQTKIRNGAWVTTSERYARQHSQHPTDPSQDMPVISTTVPARHLWTSTDEMNEQGYHGPDIETGKHLASRPFVREARFGAFEPHQDAFYRAHEAITQGGHDLVRYPDKQTFGEAAKRVLRTNGHPRADDLRVMSWAAPESVASHAPDGTPMLLVGRPHLNSHVMLHETAHLLDQHAQGRSEGGNDEHSHGPGFVDRFRGLLSQQGHGDALSAFDQHYQRHTATRFTPNKRLFGPTYGLDHRLFDGEHLRPDVTAYVLGTLDAFWRPVYGSGWKTWARVYLAGSEASEWTSETLEGNSDFDILVGIDYDGMREQLGGLIGQMTDEQITNALNKQFRQGLIPKTDPVMIPIDGVSTGPWSNTWFVNPNSLDIREIKPYAAYDITRDEWAVKPPHLPDWNIESFPEGHALLKECRAYETLVRSILAMPEPYRSQQADALWRHLHSDRGRAFGPQGEGWWDAGNVIEKWLDQVGLWEQLAEAHFAAVHDPTKLLAPSDWSNDPRGIAAQTSA